MPQVEWNDHNMKYSICFFPLIGVVIGMLVCGWYYLANFLNLNNTVFATVAACIPTIVTGGIHMDGFCDTTDARSSHQTREKKIEILKDSNSGAFAIIKTCVYFLLYYGAFTQLNRTGLYVISVGYVISRALSGLAVVNFRAAKKNGLVATFKNAAHKRNVSIALIVILFVASFGIMSISVIYGMIAIGCAAVTFLYYRMMSYKEFGGVTGDLAGYFLVL